MVDDDDIEKIMGQEGLRRASSVQIAMCEDPMCCAVHIVLLDEKDQPFAQALIGEDVGQNLVRQMYEVWQTKMAPPEGSSTQ